MPLDDTGSAIRAQQAIDDTLENGGGHVSLRDLLMDVGADRRRKARLDVRGDDQASVHAHLSLAVAVLVLSVIAMMVFTGP